MIRPLILGLGLATLGLLGAQAMSESGGGPPGGPRSTGPLSAMRTAVSVAVPWLLAPRLEWTPDRPDVGRPAESLTLRRTFGLGAARDGPIAFPEESTLVPDLDPSAPPVVRRGGVIEGE